MSTNASEYHAPFSIPIVPRILLAACTRSRRTLILFITQLYQPRQQVFLGREEPATTIQTSSSKLTLRKRSFSTRILHQESTFDFWTLPPLGTCKASRVYSTTSFLLSLWRNQVLGTFFSSCDADGWRSLFIGEAKEHHRYVCARPAFPPRLLRQKHAMLGQGPLDTEP